ncbi:hypothetical protein V6N13_102199 [Hibiscus sabdariffa]
MRNAQLSKLMETSVQDSVAENKALLLDLSNSNVVSGWYGGSEWTRGIYFIGKLQALSLDFSEISYCICDGKDLASLLENQYGSWIEEVPPVVVPFIKKDKQAFEPP